MTYILFGKDGCGKNFFYYYYHYNVFLDYKYIDEKYIIYVFFNLQLTQSVTFLYCVYQEMSMPHSILQQLIAKQNGKIAKYVKTIAIIQVIKLQKIKKINNQTLLTLP